MMSESALNRPKHKRDIKDEHFPAWSQKKKCVFSVRSCPMVSGPDELGEASSFRITQSGSKYELWAPSGVTTFDKPKKETESIQQNGQNSRNRGKDNYVHVSDSSPELRTQPPCPTLDLLGPQMNGTMTCTTPKAYAALQKQTCPFTQTIESCPKNCRCENKPPVDTGPSFRFLPLQCPCCTEPQCPLNRITKCPLIQNPPLPTPREGGQCSCCIPNAPNSCLFTLPGGVQSTSLLGNRFLPLSGLVPRHPTTGVPCPDIACLVQSSPLLQPTNLPNHVTPPCYCTQNALASLRLQGFDPVWQQPEGMSQLSFEKPKGKPEVSLEKTKETTVKKRPKAQLGDTGKSAMPERPPVAPEIKVKGGATLIKEGDGFKVFQKGNKKILVNYKEKNCWLMGCPCGRNDSEDHGESDENCGCNDWVSSAIKKKKHAAMSTNGNKTKAPAQSNATELPHKDTKPKSASGGVDVTNGGTSSIDVNLSPEQPKVKREEFNDSLEQPKVKRQQHNLSPEQPKVKSEQHNLSPELPEDKSISPEQPQVKSELINHSPEQPKVKSEQPKALDSSQSPSYGQTSFKQAGECHCVETFHCGMEQFKQQQFNKMGPSAWSKPISVKTDNTLSSAPSVVPSVFSITAPSNESNY